MTERSLLVVGESLVDLIEENQEGDRAYRPRYGGSPLNVAVGASRLGASVQFVTALGADAFGQQITEFLQTEKVAVVNDVDPTRQTCLAVATAKEGTISYEYFGDPSSMTDIRRVPPELIDTASVVHAGSTALLTSPVRNAVLQTFRDTTAFKTVDPNPRPFLIANPEDYRTGLEQVLRLANLVKLSAEDVAYLYPRRTRHEVALALLERGVTAVIVTAANEPALVATTHGSELIEIPQIHAVDSTGAGDSFMASLLADITTQGTPADLNSWTRLARTAAAAAAFTCRSVGGASSMPRAKDLHRSAIAP